MKAIVDGDLCTACGLCAETCPEVFALEDDDEVARVLVAVVPSEHEDACREAAEECPAEAISIQE